MTNAIQRDTLAAPPMQPASRPPDPLTFLTLHGTFCLPCYVLGKRPIDTPAGILGGDRFRRTDPETSIYRRQARGRVLMHLATVHRPLAECVYPAFTRAHPLKAAALTDTTPVRY